MFSLRPYQTDALAAIRKEFAEHSSTMLVMATGLGKTEVFTQLLGDWKDGRSLVIAPLIELVGQTAKKITKRTGIAPGIEQGGIRSNEEFFTRSPFVVASKQSLASGREAKRYSRIGDVGLVVVDECHLAATKEYAGIIDHYKSQGAKILPVTATPKRHDKRAMKQIAETCAFQYGICEAVPDGWLVPSLCHCIQLESLDLSQVESKDTAYYGKDFNQTQLNAAMEDDKTIFEIADVTAKETRGLRTVVYCSSVDEAKGVAEKLRDSYGIPADWICSELKRCSKQKRKDVLEGFTERGDVTHVCQVGILTTGWDYPELQALVMARPTQSLSLYTQIYGRGTRPLDGVVDFAESTADARRAAIAASAKPNFLMIDLVDNSLCHKIVTAVDVLGGKFSLVAQQRAKGEAIKGGGPIDLQAALSKAENDIERERIQEQIRQKEEADRRRLKEEEEQKRRDDKLRRRREKTLADAKYKKLKVNPLGGYKEADVQTGGGVARKRPTDKMLGFLRWKKVPFDAETISFGQASRMIGQLKAGKSVEEIMKTNRLGPKPATENPPSLLIPSLARRAQQDIDIDRINAMLMEH